MVFELKTCPHCGTEGILIMADGRCPHCKRMLSPVHEPSYEDQIGTTINVDSEQSQKIADEHQPSNHINVPSEQSIASIPKKTCNLCGSDIDIISRFVSCGSLISFKDKYGYRKQKKGEIELWYINICLKCFTKFYYNLLKRKRGKIPKNLKFALWGFTYGLVSVFWIYMRETRPRSGFETIFNIPIAIFLTIGIFAGWIGILLLFNILISYLLTSRQIGKFEKNKKVPRTMGKKVLKKCAEYIVVLYEEGRNEELYGEFILPRYPQIAPIYDYDKIEMQVILRVGKTSYKALKHPWWSWSWSQVQAEEWEEYKKEIGELYI